jgi:hypothetical protein
LDFFYPYELLPLSLTPLVELKFELRASHLQSRHSAASATPLPHEFVWRTSQDYCVALEITCTVFDLW